MKIKFYGILTVEAALKAVESDGYALQYVKDQTEPVCLKAVERNGDALRYILSLELFLKVAAKLGIEVEE
jgi:Domain of unknown function (DUF4116)